MDFTEGCELVREWFVVPHAGMLTDGHSSTRGLFGLYDNPRLLRAPTLTYHHLDSRCHQDFLARWLMIVCSSMARPHFRHDPLLPLFLLLAQGFYRDNRYTLQNCQNLE